MDDPITVYEADNLIASLREHRNFLANELEKSVEDYNTLFAKVVELEIEVSQLKMEAEEYETRIEQYLITLDLLTVKESLSGIVGEPQ
jgi:uncharacterized protein involved in exopolysaccharide biosynthesis